MADQKYIEILCKELAKIISPMHVTPLGDRYYTQQTVETERLLQEFAKEVQRASIEGDWR